MNTLAYILMTVIFMLVLVFIAHATKVMIEAVNSFKPIGRYMRENVEWTAVDTLIYTIAVLAVLTSFLWAYLYLLQ